MMLRCNLLIDFSSGPVPGQLSAVMRCVGTDGVILWTSDPRPVAVGQSLGFGPVLIETAQVVTVTPTPAAAAAQTVAAARAATSAGS